MKRFVKALFLFLVAVMLTAFAVANRHSVRFVLDPFINREAALGLDAPLYLLLFGALFVGMIIGALGAWFGQARWRRMARKGKREAEIWQREAEKLKRGIQANSSPSASTTPAIRA